MNGPADAIDLIRSTVFDPPGAGADHDYLALRGRLNIDAFLPLHSSHAAAAALRRRTDETRLVGWLGRATLSAGIASGIVPRLVRSRFTLPAAGPTNLAGAVAAALGRDDLVLAGVLGPVRPNLKPVLQVFDTDGATLAYVKIGWNDLTRRLVQHEHEVLTSLAPAPGIEVPRALALLEVGEAIGLVLSPLALWHVGPRPRTAPPAAVVRAVAQIAGPLQRIALTRSPFFAELRQVAEEPATRHGATLGAALDQVGAALDGFEHDFGASHGDFSPWNTLRAHGRIAIWDWERFRRDVPVGIDLLHYVTQQRARRPLESLPKVAAGDFAVARPALDELGVPDALVDGFVTLYYADLLARYERDARGGDAPGLAEMRDVIARALQIRIREVAP